MMSISVRVSARPQLACFLISERQDRPNAFAEIQVRRRCSRLLCFFERMGPCRVDLDLALELALGGLEFAELDGELAGLAPGCRSCLRELANLLVDLGGVVAAQDAAELGV